MQFPVPVFLEGFLEEEAPLNTSQVRAGRDDAEPGVGAAAAAAAAAAGGPPAGRRRPR